MTELSLDFRETAVKTPSGIRQQYINIIPRFLASHPDLSPQEALDYIRSSERESRTFLFQSSMSPDATIGQVMVFDRKRLQLKKRLSILEEEDIQQLDRSNLFFQELSAQIVDQKHIDPERAEDLVMKVSVFNRAQTPQEAVGLLLNGPVINGFSKDEVFKMPDEKIDEFLRATFGSDLLFEGRLLSIQKLKGFPVVCKDIALGNSYIQHGARWEGGFLVLPTPETYAEFERSVEEVESEDQLDHRYKLRAVTNTGAGFSTIKVYEFAVEKPSHFDYLADLNFSDDQKMQAYFLGIIAHEVVHTLKTFKFSPEDFERFQQITFTEHGQNLHHAFVSAYVNRHKDLYESNDSQVTDEDLSESVRIYLTNVDFLKTHFPQRYRFINQHLPQLNENAIQQYMDRPTPD